MPLPSGLFSLVCRGETDALEFREAGVVGVAEVFALLAGISRSDMTMVAGLVRGLDHDNVVGVCKFFCNSPLHGQHVRHPANAY